MVLPIMLMVVLFCGLWGVSGLAGGFLGRVEVGVWDYRRCLEVVKVSEVCVSCECVCASDERRCLGSGNED